jgi:hypothetical protein
VVYLLYICIISMCFSYSTYISSWEPATYLKQRG